MEVKPFVFSIYSAAQAWSNPDFLSPFAER